MQVHQTPTLLLTRPVAASERFAKNLTGARIVIAPLMEIKGTGAAVSLAGIDGLILTSEAAVACLPAAISLPAYCVGPRTAQTARDAGLMAEILGPDAEGLVTALADRRPTQRLLHIHGTHARGDVAHRLRMAGLSVTDIAAYEQRELPPSVAFQKALSQPQLVVPLFSPRSARLFAQAALTLRPDTQILALSPAVTQALPNAMQGQARHVPTPTGAAMDDALAQLGVIRDCP